MMAEVDLWLPNLLWHQMQREVTSLSPEEACGLVAGQGRRAQILYPVTNLLHSPTRYRLEPGEQVRAFLDLEQRGLTLQAIYHSHPNGPSRPSPTDIAESFYPEVIYLIWSPNKLHWQCRGFFIQGGTIRNAKIERLA